MSLPAPLRIRDLSKTVPGGRVLFEGLDLDLSAGEVVAITGESGAGKSSLLNLVAGLDAPDGGEIWIGGRALSGLNETERTRLRREQLGFVFQAFHILPHLTLAQNTALPLVLAGVEGDTALARAAELLAAVGLGELQRTAIARALVHQPGLILADEPTGNLDPETADRSLALLLDAARTRGASVLLVTHSVRAAEAADRTLILGRSGLRDPHGG